MLKVRDLPVLLHLLKVRGDVRENGVVDVDISDVDQRGNRATKNEEASEIREDQKYAQPCGFVFPLSPHSSHGRAESQPRC